MIIFATIKVVESSRCCHCAGVFIAHASRLYQAAPPGAAQSARGMLKLRLLRQKLCYTRYDIFVARVKSRVDKCFYNTRFLTAQIVAQLHRNT